MAIFMTGSHDWLGHVSSSPHGLLPSAKLDQLLYMAVLGQCSKNMKWKP